MITLATLKDATAQQVFDQVAAHMIKQNAASRSEDGLKCMYRGAEGRMCAAGCLMSDDEYKPEFDKGQSYGGGSWSSMVRNGSVPDDHKHLIMRLQRLHDNGYPESYARELWRLADDQGLVFNYAG